MSRVFTVGQRTRTQTAGKKSSRKSFKKATTLSSRTEVGLKDPSLSSQQVIGANNLEKSGASAKPKSANNQSRKPRVVTYADLNPRGTKKSNTRTTNRTPLSSKPPSQNFRTKTDRKKGKRMWDDNPHPDNGSSYSNSLRGARNVASNNVNQGTRGASNTSINSPESNLTGVGDGQAQRRGTYQPQGGYTLVQPDPKKRDKLQTQRSSELERLELYKEKNKLGHVSMKPSRVGGSKLSEEEARRKQQKEQQDKKYEMIRKRQQWAEEKKQREALEYDEKKAKAREQTERNRQRELERQRDLRAERHDWIGRGGLENLQGGATSEAAEENHDKDAETESALDGLEEIFPYKSRTKLQEMLRAAHGDVNKVIDWLSN